MANDISGALHSSNKNANNSPNDSTDSNTKKSHKLANSIPVAKSLSAARSWRRCTKTRNSPAVVRAMLLRYVARPNDRAAVADLLTAS